MFYEESKKGSIAISIDDVEIDPKENLAVR